MTTAALLGVESLGVYAHGCGCVEELRNRAARVSGGENALGLVEVGTFDRQIGIDFEHIPNVRQKIVQFDRDAHAGALGTLHNRLRGRVEARRPGKR